MESDNTKRLGNSWRLLKAYFHGGNTIGLNALQIDQAASTVATYGRTPDSISTHNYQGFGVKLIEEFLIGSGLRGVWKSKEVRERIDKVIKFASPLSWN